MTLAQRLLLAIGVVTVATAAVLALGVREAWRTTEESRFRDEFNHAVARLEADLADEVRTLPGFLSPLCKHDPVLDAALVDLEVGRFDPGRRLALSLRIPELMKAFRFDELTLVTDDGEVLGAGHAPGRVGANDVELARRLGRASETAVLRSTPPPVALEAHCTLRGKRLVLGLFAARHLESLLRQAGQAHGLTLSVARPDNSEGAMVQAVELSQLGLRVFATRSRVPLREALQTLDATIVLLGAGSVGLALVVAWLLARGLARPIVDLSAEARKVVAGEPRFVEGRGGRELAELAGTFNQAIRDLTELRKRLAATERIAARREIARRVAHEIKNPLAPIRAAVETLRRLRARQDAAFDEYFDEATRTVLDEVQRITNIVQEFTRFARLPPPSPAPLDLSKTVRDVVQLHAAGGTPIETELEEIEILADRDQMVQVLTNLLQNAIDAVAARKDPWVAVTVRRDGAHVALVVSDNGPGIAREIRERLFEPYATTKEHGTGLGLAIAQRIAIEHGGSLEYDEAPEGGARFTMTLPVTGPTLLPEAPPASAP